MRRRWVALSTWATVATVLTVPLGAVGGTEMATSSETDAETELRDRIETLVTGHLGETTPGAMVTVVDSAGPLVTETWGWADPVAETPLTPDSRAPAASVSKVVTALTALQLHHAGLLDLDADIRTYLPVQDTRTDAQQRPVTGRHLLTHHAGIVEPLMLHPEPGVAHPGDFLPVLERYPPELGRPSGVGMHYSALDAYTLLGAAIEEASGESFDAAVERWVLGPIGADRAEFDSQDNDVGDVGDVHLSTRDGTGWAHTSWPAMQERPALALTWSVRDAAALLQELLATDALPEAVVAEAFTTVIRPAHGGGGHTQVFFESWRSQVPVLEHAGANGLAWIALIPDANVGIYAAVTTEDLAAGQLTSDLLDEVAQWAVDSGRTQPAPMPRGGQPTITPEWAANPEPVEPVGIFHEQTFGSLGPELPLRTFSGQITVTADGEDLLMSDRRLSPSGTPGRWCDSQGCIAGARTADGTVLLLRSDQPMLQQTLVPAAWWSDVRFVTLALTGTALMTVFSISGAIRAGWLRRRHRETAAAVSRPLAVAWTAVSWVTVLGTGWLLLSSLTANTATWIAADGFAVWALRVLTLVQLGVGGTWFALMLRRFAGLSRWRRVLVWPAAVTGIAMSTVLLTWALPHS